MVSDVTLQTAVEQQSKTSLASAGLAEDFSQFLQLLTVQLQNQDPLSPMDTTEFTNQLVAFTGVEQQINANQKLDSLVALGIGNSLSSAQNYVGQNISYVSSEFNFDGTPSNMRYSLTGAAEKATVRISNEDGRVVYEESVSGNPGANEFTWDGRLTGGGVAPDGTYEITVDAIDAGGNAVSSTTVVTGTVRGVETQNGETLLLVGERAVALANVLNTSQAVNNDTSNSITAALSYIGLDISYPNDEILLSSTGSVTIDYNLPEKADRAKILIYDTNNKLVFTDNIDTRAGDHSYEWDGDNLPAGEYRYEIDAISQGSSLIKSSTVTYDGTEDINVNYNLNTTADDVEIVIRNASGNLVATDTASKRSGSNTYTWEPDDSVKPGEYTIEITAIDDTDSRLPVSSSTVGRVTGVESDNGVIFLQVGPSSFIPLSEVLSVSVPHNSSEGV